MTPHELNLHIVEYGQRVQLEQEERLTLAYLAAYWQRVKQMPALKDLIKPKEQPPQTDDAMLAMVKQLNAQLGGEIT